MLHWALVFFLLSIVAAVFGFWGIAGTFSWGAKTLFVAFIVLTVVFTLVGRKPPVV